MKHLLITTIAAVVLVGCGSPDRALFTAVHEESIQAVEQAIAAGADVNAKDDSNITPLLWAIDKSHKEIVELLITKGADVNFKDIADHPPPARHVGGGVRWLSTNQWGISSHL